MKARTEPLHKMYSTLFLQNLNLYGKWTPIPMYCSNCGQLNYGFRNDEGKIKYECKKCKVVAVRTQKGRRHDRIDLFAPVGQVSCEI